MESLAIAPRLARGIRAAPASKPDCARNSRLLITPPFVPLYLPGIIAERLIVDPIEVNESRFCIRIQDLYSVWSMRTAPHEVPSTYWDRSASHHQRAGMSVHRRDYKNTIREALLSLLARAGSAFLTTYLRNAMHRLLGLQALETSLAYPRFSPR